MEPLSIYLLLMNLISFVLSYFDKRAAINHRWRIPEKTLFLSAILGGSLGLYLSMKIFRHKTKHLSFMLGVPAILMIQLIVVWFFFIKS